MRGAPAEPIYPSPQALSAFPRQRDGTSIREPGDSGVMASEWDSSDEEAFRVQDTDQIDFEDDDDFDCDYGSDIDEDLYPDTRSEHST